MPPMPEGELKKDYLLIERLAVGGMAEVFLAEDLDRRVVVVKRILPHLAINADFVRMFMNEAHIAARINHPNVVHILERGEANGHPFIAMEYVPGVTVKQLIHALNKAGRTAPISVAVDILRQACAGSHAAHELLGSDGSPIELVHRDLTPHNLMLDVHGDLKVLDFGIAKATTGVDDHTRTGMLKGKISYMSPEQCRQEPLDRRSDLFTLGIVAFELLAGNKPFQSRTELGIMQAIVSGNTLSLAEACPHLPAPLVEAVERCLAADRADRYPTAADMANGLVLAAEAVGEPPDQARTGALIRELFGDDLERKVASLQTLRDSTLPSLGSIHLLDPPTAELEIPGRTTTTSPEWDDPLSTESVPLPAAVLTPIPQPLPVGSRRAWAALAVVVLVVAAAVGFWLTRPMVLSGDPVEVLIAPTFKPEVLRQEHEPIRTYLEGRFGRPVHFEIASSYRDASDRLTRGDVPFAFLPYRTTMRALEQGAKLEVLAVKVVDGSASTDGYLIVARTNPARTVEDLRGATICYSDPLSFTGYELPRRYIRDMGMDPEAEFGQHLSGNHEAVLRDLLAGKCAVGGTFSGNFGTADQRGIPTARLRVLALTGVSPHDAMTAGPAASEADSKALARALLEFRAQDLGLSHVGESERITAFSAPDAAYQPSANAAVDGR
jgi:eukaryotic-like serine/threonine-protein kinase